jgi:hypothetical protein
MTESRYSEACHHRLAQVRTSGRLPACGSEASSSFTRALNALTQEALICTMQRRGHGGDPRRNSGGGVASVPSPLQQEPSQKWNDVPTSISVESRSDTPTQETGNPKAVLSHSREFSGQRGDTRFAATLRVPVEMSCSKSVAPDRRSGRTDAHSAENHRLGHHLPPHLQESPVKSGNDKGAGCAFLSRSGI